MCPYNGSGVYELPSNTFNPAVANTEIDADDWNTSAADLETALSSVITKDGQTITTASIPFAAGVTINNTGLKILDTNASHTLALVPGSDLSANRTLTLTTGDANRTLTLGGDASLSGVTITGTGTLATTSGKTQTFSNTLTFTGTDGSSVNFGTGGTVLYSGGSYVSSIAGTANEITASAATGAVTLSLPSALTFTGKTITGGTYASPALTGTATAVSLYASTAVAQRQSGSVAKATGTNGSRADSGFSFTSSQVMTVTLDNYFIDLCISDSNGAACRVTGTYGPATLTITGDTNFVTGAPGAGQTRITKPSNSTVLTLTNGASITASVFYLNAIGSTISAITDPA